MAHYYHVMYYAMILHAHNYARIVIIHLYTVIFRSVVVWAIIFISECVFNIGNGKNEWLFVYFHAMQYASCNV